jgi:hypothetical protein
MTLATSNQTDAAAPCAYNMHEADMRLQRFTHSLKFHL